MLAVWITPSDQQCPPSPSPEEPSSIILCSTLRAVNGIYLPIPGKCSPIYFVRNRHGQQRLGAYLTNVGKSSACLESRYK